MKRIIARLDIKNEFVIKGFQLEGLRKIGLIQEIARIRENQYVDEILLLDAVASLYRRRSMVETVKEATNDIFIPITAGGGITSLSDARELFLAGADRVALNSATFENPSLIRQISDVYGAQAVVISIEARRIGPNTWNCFTNSGRHDTGVPVENWASSWCDGAVGEVLVTSVDMDGSRRGPDLQLLRRLSVIGDVQFVYSGGILSGEQCSVVLEQENVSGVAIGAAFHFGDLAPNSLKITLQERGIPISRVPK